MEKELDPEVIKTTQIMLGKYVKRPPLSEKLLKKPPFRFLHDVITNVLKTTGFFENLFEEDELVSDNVKDRDSKILFLNKVIFVVGATTQKTISAKPSKIVAGQEPEKTNELLQCLAQALDDNLSSDKAVKQYRDSLKSTKTTESKAKESNKVTKQKNDTKKLASKSSEKLINQKNEVARSTIKQDKEKSSDIKPKKKDSVQSKGEQQSKKTQQLKVLKKNSIESNEPIKDDNILSRNKKAAQNVKEKEVIENELTPDPSNALFSRESDVSIERVDNLDDKINIDTTKNQDDQDQLNTSYTINKSDLNSSASSNDLLDAPSNNVENKLSDNNVILHYDQQMNIDTNVNGQSKNVEADTNILDKPKQVILSKEAENETNDPVNHDSLNAVTVPPMSGNDNKFSRPQSVRPSSVRPSSSRPGAPRMREKVDNIIKETDNLLIGKVNIIIENTQNEEEEDTSLIITTDLPATSTGSQDQQDLQISSNEHGHLVQQILESQKELTQISGKTEIEWQFGAQKAREAVNQDVEQLRFNIQALSRVANPLGKLLDHVQEDVEVMRQELLQWTNIYEDVNKDMLKQKSLNEDTLMPFHTKLKQLDTDIEEKHDKINDLKISIHKNSVRIEKLLSSGNVQ